MARPSFTLSRRTLAHLLAAAPMALAAGRAVAQGTAWSMATEYPATTVSGEGIAFFAGRLAEESSGRLTIAPSYDAPGGLKSADIVAAIRDGRLAAGDFFAGALGRIDPLFALSSLPFVAPGPAEALRLLDTARGLYANRFAREKQRLLYATPWPASGLWAKKPIVTPADLAGLPLRVYDFDRVCAVRRGRRASCEPLLCRRHAAHRRRLDRGGAVVGRRRRGPEIMELPALLHRDRLRHAALLRNARPAAL